MKQQFSTMNMMSQNASSVNACFAAAICLIMMDAISVVSIILLLGIVFIGFIILALLPRLLRNQGRKCTMVVSNA